MPGIYLPPKLFEPNLLTPQSKPVGPVEIDWDNSLSEHLLYAQLFDAEYPADLVNGVLPILGGNNKFEINDRGKGANFGNTTPGDYFDTNISPDFHGDQKEFSVFMMLRSSDTNGSYIRQTDNDFEGGGSKRKWSFYPTSDNRLSHLTGAVVGTIIGPSVWFPSATEWMLLSFSKRQSTTSGGGIRAFENGLLLGSHNINSNSGDTEKITITIGSGWNNKPTSESPISGDWGLVYIWEDRYLSDAEHLRLALNPYQFLKPRGMR